VVIDTNVIRAADGRASHASDDCQAASAGLLGRAACEVVHLDAGIEILREYLGELDQTQPYRAGTRFVHELLRIQADPRRCIRVPITPDATRGYTEFPDDDRLRNFDADDRKFVAVAVGAGAPRPVIVNATDSDWAPVADVFAEHGVVVEQLCPQDHPRLRAGRE